MKVLLVSEGKHENGGALQTLIDRISGISNEYELFAANDASIRSSHGVPGVGSRLVKRVKAFGRLAREKRCEALIYLIDQDRDPRRRLALDSAQADPASLIAQALGVAVETFDAWILADERALSTVLQYSVDRQRDPETLRDAKSVCEALRNGSEGDLPLRKMYAAVCSHVDFNTLTTRCPAGFAIFAQRVRALFHTPD